MHWSSFTAGVHDVTPALPANATIGVLFGASAVQVGITSAPATAFSLFAMAARAQLAAVELLQNDATLPVVLATILLINLRYVTFSAAIAPKIEHLSGRWRAIIAYPLIDITYAFADARFSASDPAEIHRGWYYLGISLPWVVVYVATTFAGTLLGQAVGDEFHLDFMIPLIFIALLVPQVEARAGLLAALAAGGVAVLAAGLPFNLGLLAASLVGAGVGGVIDADPLGWFQ